MTIPPAHFEAIHRFLAEVGEGSLFDYYGAPSDAPDADLEALIGARRRWAQAQQTNPKFRAEAVWLIRNQTAIRKALLKERESYLKYCQAKSESRNLEFLSLFIRGVTVNGRLTVDAEQTVRRQAERLGIPDAVLAPHLEDLLRQGETVRGEAATAPADGSEERRLNTRIREIRAQQLLPSQQIERILSAGRDRNLSPHQQRVRLEKAILRTQGIETTPPPRRPATWQTLTPMDRDKLHPLVDALRDTMMKGLLDESMEQRLSLQARNAGVSPEIWNGLVSTSKHHLAAFRAGQADPWQVLGLSNPRAHDEARRAYVQLRRWAWSHTDPIQCASTILELDAAWTTILRP